MSQTTIEQLEQAWDQLQALAPIAVIRTDRQYDQALATLHRLLDLVGEDETHPLYELLDTLGVLIHTYEESLLPANTATGIDVLRLLIDEHELTAVDLPELGTPAEVAALLAGRIALTTPQIQALAARFGVAPATFA